MHFQLNNFRNKFLEENLFKKSEAMKSIKEYCLYNLITPLIYCCVYVNPSLLASYLTKNISFYLFYLDVILYLSVNLSFI
jgi:hypothetical protein